MPKYTLQRRTSEGVIKQQRTIDTDDSTFDQAAVTIVYGLLPKEDPHLKAHQSRRLQLILSETLEWMYAHDPSPGTRTRVMLPADLGKLEVHVFS